MKKIKFLPVLLVLLMLVIPFTGCSSNETNAPSAPSAPSAPPATPSAPPASSTSSSEYDGPVTKMKLAFGTIPEGKVGLAAKDFANKVSERTNGKVTVELYPSGLLGSEREAAEGVSLGTIEMTVTGMGTFASFYAPLQMFNAPFLFDSREHSYAFFDGEYMKEINEAVRQQSGIRVMGYCENGLRCFSNDVRELRKPEDFKGLKMRVQENPIHIAMMQSLGSTATPINYSELYTALAQKTVDGQDNPVSLFVENKMNEVQKYFTIDNHVYDQLVIQANDEWFTGLPTSLQNILEEEIIAFRDNERKLSIEMEASGIEKVKASGVIVTELSKEEMKAIRDTVIPTTSEATKKVVGEEFFNKTMAAIEACRP